MTELIFLLGSGGVGKTSTSVLLSLHHASKKNKVVLISIDPAKRLADSMGLTLGNNLTAVNINNISFDAMMLDQKLAFDESVLKFSKNKKTAQKIIDHPFYQHTSKNLAGISEFMAMNKVYELYQSSAYDYIIVDTPPDIHALDFFAKPKLLADFQDLKIIKWISTPFKLIKGLKLNSKKEKGGFWSSLTNLVGISAYESFVDFLDASKDVIQSMNINGQEILSIFSSEKTKFAIVTRPNHSSMRSSLYLTEKLKELSYSTDFLIINRVIPTQNSYTPKESVRLEGEKRILDKIQRNKNFLPSKIIKIEEHHKNIEKLEDLVDLLQKTSFEK